MNTRRTHKLLFSQLQMVKFLLDFLDSSPGIQDGSFSGVRNEMIEAKQHWKTLKAEYQEQVEAIKKAAPETLARLEEVRHRAQLLEEALRRYQAKKEEVEEKVKSAQDRRHKEQERLQKLQEQMEGQLADVQDRLQTHQKELQLLQGELEEQERLSCDWQQKVQRISDFQCFVEALQGVKLISASESDLELELTSPSQPGTTEPHSVKLGLQWGEDGNITLQSGWPFFLVSTVLPAGTRGTLKNILLELQQGYLQQAQLLAEIEFLQNCFAIDWLPEERLLRYLKLSSTCSLRVEPGYPTSGGIRLLSITSQYGDVDVTSYRPSQERPSLRDWLKYLNAVDFSADSLVRAATKSPV